MKTFLLQILLTFYITSLNAQLPEGVYVSNPNSFRTNYFLNVEKDSVTFFGWENTINNDTIYFKSICKNNLKSGLVFTNFNFTKSKISLNNFGNFVPEPSIKIENFWLHRYFSNFEVVNKKIFLLATKDMYDSRADKFEFIKAD